MQHVDKNAKKIEIRCLGLATGSIVPVRRIRRRKIEVTYVPSD